VSAFDTPSEQQVSEEAEPCGSVDVMAQEGLRVPVGCRCATPDHRRAAGDHCRPASECHRAYLATDCQKIPGPNSRLAIDQLDGEPLASDIFEVRAPNVSMRFCTVTWYVRSMYVSPAVRSIAEDPIDGEAVTLLVEVDDDYEPGADAVADRIEALDGSVEDRRRFGTLVVSIAQTSVDEVCDLDGLAVVETDNAVTIGSDGAGEDIE
jgi:hypothetical protein